MEARFREPVAGAQHHEPKSPPSWFTSQVVLEARTQCVLPSTGQKKDVRVSPVWMISGFLEGGPSCRAS
jgi:hypothetical protein